jgi:acyl dehydratase
MMHEEIARFIAAETGKTYVSDWIDVDQQLIDGFADLTRDWNFIHVDAQRAAQTPLGGTIAHGFLVLSLLAPLRQGCDRPPFPRLTMGMNYGLERVRFVSPVHAGSRVRGHFAIDSIVERAPGQYLEEMGVSIEIEGGARPAIAARWLTLYVA